MAKANVIELFPDESEKAREAFIEELNADNVSHGVFVFRTKDGRIFWHTFNEDGEDHTTYFLGLLERAKQAISTT